MGQPVSGLRGPCEEIGLAQRTESSSTCAFDPAPYVGVSKRVQIAPTGATEGAKVAQLASSMPAVKIKESELKKWGELWLADHIPDSDKAKQPERFTRKQSVQFASFIDEAVANSVRKMLGDIPMVRSGGKLLRPEADDVVEWGAVRIVGGVRPQNFDVAYRPDGPRIAFDSKTLNDKKSIGKNWQNMINDLATEAATVHTRFPYAVVGLMVILPRPALEEKQEADIIRTLERLGSRVEVVDQTHLAEVISLVVWDPKSGEIDPDTPNQSSTLRYEKFSETMYPRYVNRYKGLPPHDELKEEEDDEVEDDEGDEEAE